MKIKNLLLVTTILGATGVASGHSLAAETNLRDPIVSTNYKVETKTINSIPEPNWVFNSGMSKGKYHDRQPLDFILRGGTVLKIRQSNPNYSGKLTLDLLGNDSAQEKSISFGNDWVSISSDNPLVPFVKTPYGSTNATIEYQIESNIKQKPLPIYTYNDNQSSFFEVWDKFDADYALIQDQDFELFVPKRDKELIRQNKDYSSIDDLITHYREIFSLYNKMSGFDDSSPTNQNGKNRYFLKADVHGAGGAYYSDKYTANTSVSADMWLKKLDWATLHEIGHGYQAGFDGQGMYTGEVSNNLFGVQYQYAKYGKQADKIGWLFNYGKKESVEQDLYNKLILQHGNYSSVGLRNQLILLTMLKQKAGDQAFTNMYKGYRLAANQPNFSKKDYQLPDLINHYYSENSTLDFSPVLERLGLKLTKNQPELNRAKGYKGVALLADVVSKSDLGKVRQKLDPNTLITSNFQLVTNNDIKDFGLSGNLTLKLKGIQSNELQGEKIQLKDGSTVVQEKEIVGESVLFDNVPNGVYTVSVIGDKMNSYEMKDHYAYVKEKENLTDITFSKLKNSSLVNQSITFLGLGNSPFCTFSTDLNRSSYDIKLSAKNPHSYYRGETYAKITIIDSSGQVKYDKIITGTDNVIGTDTIPVNIGDVITIYHAEARSRLVSEDNLIDKTKTTNIYQMTKWGLKNEAVQLDPQQTLINNIIKKGDSLLNNPEKMSVPITDSGEKKDIVLAIELLDEPQKTEYKAKFARIFE